MKTTPLNQDFVDILVERGFVAQATDMEGIRAECRQGPITAYIGFDATAESLHVGHLVSLMSMRWLAACGHNVIALVGGATTMVGDPSFRNTARPLLTKEDIARNIALIKNNIETVMGEHKHRLTVVNNDDWLGSVGMIDFMRDVGSHFSVARMLTMDSVRTRLDENNSLSMLEFTYMLLQSADFLELFRQKGCKLQMGGSDQWGNIVNGIELVRRVTGETVFGLTTNLLVNASGQKMGKTQSGAVWLSADKLDPFDHWQFWRNTDDADVARFLALFTDMPMEDIRGVTATAVDINKAKETLADRVTALLHGKDNADNARNKATMLFGAGDEITHSISVEGQIGVIDLIKQIGFAQTSGEVRRLMEGGAVRINDIVISDQKAVLVVRDTGPFRLSVGKKKRAVIALT